MHSSDHAANGARRDERPRVVLFDGETASARGDDEFSDVQSELDLDLYDTDEIPDQSLTTSFSLTGLQSILQHDSAISAASNRTLREQHSEVASFHGSGGRRTTATSSAARSNALETASTGHSSSSSRRLGGRRPFNPESFIRTDFTTVAATAASKDADLSTPKEDYEGLATPPGEPSAARPEELSHPAFGRAPREEMSMRGEWVLGLVVLGLGIGIAIASQDPDPKIAYWVATLSDLYVRAVACVTLPLAFCQTVISAAELTNSALLRRVCLLGAGYFLVTLLVTAWIMIGIAHAFHTMYERADEGNSFKLEHPKFAFKCANDRFLEQNAQGALQCTGLALSANSTFPHLVDVSQRLGLTETVAIVDVSGYLVALLDVYFPQNVLLALSRGNFISSMLIATALGVAIAQSFRMATGEIRRSKNPLFRLFMHVYLSLYTMLDWIHKLSLWATVPIMIGSVLAIPDARRTIHTARYYILTIVVSVLVHSVLVAPLVFFIVTKRNPFAWLRRMLAPICYAVVFQQPLYTLSFATKSVLRSREVSPAVFGAVYPLLSAINRTAFALGIPTAIYFVSAYTGCTYAASPGDTFRLFGFLIIAALGETMLPRSSLAVFLTFWRVFCASDDTPGIVIMISMISIVVVRLGASVNVTCNLLFVRMISHVVEGDLRLSSHVRPSHQAQSRPLTSVPPQRPHQRGAADDEHSSGRSSATQSSAMSVEPYVATI
ncbi:hypothetical protein P43SY_006218 [Pythium insidiosum]|uniref:Amino acid transporter n=1 Tax=Pythium insidiosum TaxID=114742 RepID=A0AAD5LDL5_PYTIN|nr:hypothetical protein P43SY_006218 [Pythium insidiosum]